MRAQLEELQRYSALKAECIDLEKDSTERIADLMIKVCLRLPPCSVHCQEMEWLRFVGDSETERVYATEPPTIDSFALACTSSQARICCTDRGPSRRDARARRGIGASYCVALLTEQDSSTCLQAKGGAGLNDEQGHNHTRHSVFTHLYLSRSTLKIGM